MLQTQEAMGQQNIIFLFLNSCLHAKNENENFRYSDISLLILRFLVGKFSWVYMVVNNFECLKSNQLQLFCGILKIPFSLYQALDWGMHQCLSKNKVNCDYLSFALALNYWSLNPVAVARKVCKEKIKIPHYYLD